MINISTFKSVFENHFRVDIEELESHYEVTLSDRFSEISFRGGIRKTENPIDVIRDIDGFFDIENELKRFEKTFINMLISKYKDEGIDLSCKILEEIIVKWDTFRYLTDRLFTKMVSELAKLPSTSLCI